MVLALTSINPLPLFERLERRLDGQRWLYPVAVAALCLLLWISATEVVRLVAFSPFYGVPFALAAVVLAAWFGGAWAGLLCAAFSVAFLSIVLPSMRFSGVREESLWHLAVFSLVAVLMSRFQSSLREQRRRTLRERDTRNEFLAIVSHEIRTPVTIIEGSANLLERRWETLPRTDRQELLQSIQAESTRLSQMFSDLLLMARLDQEQFDEPRPFDLGRVLNTVVAQFRRLHEDRVVEFQPPAGVTVVAVERYAEAVLRNVLANAHRFSAAARPIIVSVIPGPHRVTVNVRDFGVGIEPEEMRRVFEPYYRGNPLSDGTRGIGIGLALSRRVMRAMNGDIEVENAEGDGLNVAIVFPAACPGKANIVAQATIAP